MTAPQLQVAEPDPGARFPNGVSREDERVAGSLEDRNRLRVAAEKHQSSCPSHADACVESTRRPCGGALQLEEPRPRATSEDQRGSQRGAYVALAIEDGRPTRLPEGRSQLPQRVVVVAPLAVDDAEALVRVRPRDRIGVSVQDLLCPGAAPVRVFECEREQFLHRRSAPLRDLHSSNTLAPPTGSAARHLHQEPP
ncbi:hypothetical protein IMY96_03890 [Pimelobacter simplex]|nr:hypothetical protein [Pimelobacter simplex]